MADLDMHHAVRLRKSILWASKAPFHARIQPTAGRLFVNLHHLQVSFVREVLGLPYRIWPRPEPPAVGFNVVLPLFSDDTIIKQYKLRLNVIWSCCCCCCFLTLTDPLRIQPWSQDRRNQTKSNRESEMSMESRQKKDGQEVASKGHRRDKIENINKKHTDSRNKLEPTA